MKFMWMPPFRNNKERDEAIFELQEIIKELSQ